LASVIYKEIATLYILPLSPWERVPGGQERATSKTDRKSPVTKTESP